MTIISNSFAPACRQLLPKYTISTLRSIDIVDNQKGYGCILKLTRFRKVKKERQVNASKKCLPTLPHSPDRGFCEAACDRKCTHYFQNTNTTVH